MNVLVTVASRYGATREIGDRIARVLSERGHDVEVVEPTAVEGVDRFDAVVVGGAVYAGRWPRDGRELLEREAADLASKPVWVFSSGPVGDPPKPLGLPEGMTGLIQAVSPRDHIVFPGRIVHASLRLGDKAIAAALNAPEGDFRNWMAVEAWAEQIHGALTDRAYAPPADGSDGPNPATSL